MTDGTRKMVVAAIATLGVVGTWVFVATPEGLVLARGEVDGGATIDAGTISEAPPGFQICPDGSLFPEHEPCP